MDSIRITDQDGEVEPTLSAKLETSGLIARASRTGPFFTLSGAAMSEPTSTAVGSVAAWKLGAGILGIGVVASALGFMVLLPKTPREAAMRALATMIGSALFGPVLVAALFSRWPELFTAGVHLASQVGLEPWTGLFMIGAPVLAMAGLPFWWLLGAAVLWFDRRKNKDLGQLVTDARAAAGKAVAP